MSGDNGLVQERLDYLQQVIAADVARKLYYGAVIIVARHGRPGLSATVGAEDGDGKRPLRPDSVFSIFSVTKAFTNILALRAIELGQFALTTRVAEVIPEFGGGLRSQITVFHLMSHTSGLPMVWVPKPGMNIDKLDLIVQAICENIQSAEPPGERVAYSPICNQALLGEMVRRTDPRQRSYRDIARQDLFEPLKMNDTAIGRRADLKSRHVVPDMRGNVGITHPTSNNSLPNGAFEDEHAEMPWVGAVSSVPNMFRFAEMLRRGGELDGVRILSPTILARARQNWTGDKPNELYKVLAHKRGWEPSPGYIGLGFSLRGTAICHHQFGTLASPETFGNYGAGSALYWIDPALDMTFVCLTAGVMESNDNIERFQRLGDIAVSAAV